MELDLHADLGLEVATRGDLDSMHQDLIKRMTFDRHAAPFHAQDSTVAVTGSPTLVTVGGPNVGRFWEITGIYLVGGDDRTIIASTNVAFYVGNPTVAGLNDLILPGSQGGVAVGVPANAQFSRRQVICLASSQAFFAVYGATTGQILNGGVFGWDRDVLDLPIR